MAALVTRLFSVFRAFLRWWLGELAALVPARLRQRLTSTKHSLVLVLGDGDASPVLCLRTGQELQALERLELQGEADPRRKLIATLRDRGLLAAFNGGRLGLCVRIPPNRASRTIIELPIAAETNLDEVVFYELDRHTPFRPEHARFSHRILKRDVAAKRLDVELTVVPRPIVDDALAVAARLDLTPDRIDVATDASYLTASGNLLPAEGLAPTSRRVHLFSYALGGLAGLLAIVAIYIPIHAADRAAETARDELTAAKKGTAAAATLEKQIEDLRKEESFLVNRRRDAATVSKLLLETTRIMPDGTWLSEWQLAGNQVQLSGLTESASALVKLLEQSHTFQNTTFLSPVVQDPTAERERFHIAAQIVQAGAP
jgi:general secretion pathway protein L